MTTPKLTAEILKVALPGITTANAKMVAAHAPAAMERFQINTVNRVAAFIAQCAHESAMFTARKESLRYSAKRLREVFPKYFTNDAIAAAYAFDEARIASRVYSNRMGNGDVTSGFAFKTIGRGFIQLTGRNNYVAFATSMGMTFDEVIKYLETDEGAIMSAAWFFATNRCNDLADGWQITNISKRINGGSHGLEARIAFSNALRRALEASA